MGEAAREPARRSRWRFLPWALLVLALPFLHLLTHGVPYGEFIVHGFWWALVLLLMAFPGPNRAMPRLMGAFLILWILSVPAMAAFSIMAFHEHHQLERMGITRLVGAEGLRTLGVLAAVSSVMSLLLAATLLARLGVFRLLLAAAALFRIWLDFEYRLVAPEANARVLLALDVSLTMLCWAYLDGAFRQARRVVSAADAASADRSATGSSRP